MKFSSVLRDLRAKHHITQEQLADYLGITRSAVAGYETKEKQPDYDRLILIADYFNVSVDYLLRGEDSFILSAENNLSSREELNLLKAYSSLSEEYRKELSGYLEYLLSKNKKMKKLKTP